MHIVAEKKLGLAQTSFVMRLSLLSDIKGIIPLGVDLQILKRKVKAKPFNNSFKKHAILIRWTTLY